MTLSDLVDALPINNNAKTLDYTFRLMRTLIHGGFFNQTKVNDTEEGYLLTPASCLLIKEEPLSQVPFVQTELDPNFMDPWHSLSKWMKSDDHSSTPFVIAQPLYEYDERGVFEGMKSLVDVIEGCEGIKNLSYVKGNMLKFIPSADAILLKKCKEEIPSKEKGGKVIIIDMVLMDRNLEEEDDKSYETQLFFDMLRMVHVSGKERNRQDWAKLFSGAGFSDYNIIPILGLRSIIKVFP
ncbi:hypothetical protein MTR67_039551 [Solanum verrucosum]|uniref:O-methyltransferase C-terminal domain-containing protein n=1 Tax=Solanum verrucosum TaxID=315347 RepID=A0AAF0UIN6_SOLVR|nr:hypothetical protein MTR67_039551 [Solanum verrucosum]